MTNQAGRIAVGTKIRTTYEHSATGTIVKPPKSALPLPGADWYVVKFDDNGGRLCVHRSMFNVSNEPKGVTFDPKTDVEALELLRWMYGPQVPAHKSV